ncbi:MAG: phosphate acyltransferase, partial [Chloroflexi bacterium]|nr:phosphate acyltransferase [Chloroflexota bacterium]
MLIAVDAMGGEYAPREVVKGADEAVKELPPDNDLVGNKAGPEQPPGGSQIRP